jgi:hypothetical protein
MEDLLVGADGTPLIDTKSCDPFKTNLKNAIAEPSLFTPTKAAAMFFNFMIIIALAVGTWLGLYFVVNMDYDYGFRDFAGDTGKVLGKLALQTSGRVSDSAYAARQSLPSAPSLSSLTALLPSRLKAAVPAAPAAQ